MLKLSILLVASMTIAASSPAVVLTFDEVSNPVSTGTVIGPEYRYMGVTLRTSFDPIGFFAVDDGNSGYAGSTSLMASWDAAKITMTLGSGAAFNFRSIDLANYSGSNGSSVTFTGHFPGGATVTQTVAVPGGSPAFSTTSLSGFDSVTSVDWYQNLPYHQFDNVVLTPEPGAFAGLAVGLVPLLRRRKK